MSTITRARLLAAALAAISCAAQPARADAARDFYRGKTVHLILGVGVGGGVGVGVGSLEVTITAPEPVATCALL